MTCPSSNISFSQVREDHLIEFTVVDQIYAQKQKPVSILMVGSGGCTAISLVAKPEVAVVDIIDANPAQLELIKLRQQIIAFLSLEEQKILLGICGDKAQRMSLWQEKCKEKLAQPTYEYWQEYLDSIAFGLNRVGKFEELFRELVQLCSRTFGYNPAQHPQQAIKHPKWQECFDVVFEREKLARIFGRTAVDYSMSKSFAVHFAEVFKKALIRFSPQENYFLHQVWHDCYPESADKLPPYLIKKNQDIIKEHAEKLTFTQGFFAEKLLENNQKWDIIQTSNISDWMPIPEMKKMFLHVKNHLSPNGAIIARRLNGDHILEDVVASIFYTNKQLNKEMHDNDRSFFYSEVVIGFNR